ncbi:MAG: carbamoyl-phosphate synthase small subunit, partial [Pseudomonadales bacterium]|nr:carbamoyl-phosphate synthase small subunit [Pseudomonadales bacterium]
MTRPAILALEDGSVFNGIAIGANGTSTGEVVFNTSMTGYQEILTDPSYSRQIVTLTYPHIGNVGTNDEDRESDKTWVAGLVIRDLPLMASNFRNQQALDDYLLENKVVAISDIDTRKLTRILREKGSLSGCVIAADSSEQIDEQAAIAQAKAFAGLKGLDLAKEVTTDNVYQWRSSTWQLGQGSLDRPDSELEHHVV